MRNKLFLFLFITIFAGGFSTYSQEKNVVQVKLRTSLLNNDIGAEIKLHPKHSIYPYFGFGHTIMIYKDGMFLYTKDERRNIANVGYYTLNYGLEYRFYLYENESKSNGLFFGIKSKYSIGQNNLKSKKEYNYASNLKLGSGIGFQSLFSKSGRLGIETVAYPGLIFNKDFSYYEFNTFLYLRLLYILK